MYVYVRLQVPVLHLFISSLGTPTTWGAFDVKFGSNLVLRETSGDDLLSLYILTESNKVFRCVKRYSNNAAY